MPKAIVPVLFYVIYRVKHRPIAGLKPVFLSLLFRTAKSNGCDIMANCGADVTAIDRSLG
jgi:hypothetical protein